MGTAAKADSKRVVEMTAYRYTFQQKKKLNFKTTLLLSLFLGTIKRTSYKKRTLTFLIIRGFCTVPPCPEILSFALFGTHHLICTLRACPNNGNARYLRCDKSRRTMLMPLSRQFAVIKGNGQGIARLSRPIALS